MCSRDGDNQGRAHGTSPKNKWEGFRLPKCIVHSRERKRVEGTLLKAKG